MHIMHTPKINGSCKTRPQVIYIEEQIDTINCPKPIKPILLKKQDSCVKDIIFLNQNKYFRVCTYEWIEAQS